MPTYGGGVVLYIYINENNFTGKTLTLCKLVRFCYFFLLLFKRREHFSNRFEGRTFILL